jgi:hypothetical protein
MLPATSEMLPVATSEKGVRSDVVLGTQLSAFCTTSLRTPYINTTRVYSPSSVHNTRLLRVAYM